MFLDQEVLEAIGPHAMPDDLDRNERAETLRRALGQLRVDQKEILILSRFENMRYKQIAEVVGNFTSIVGGMPISVSTMNGEIDLTLPPQTQATLAINTSRGVIYTDFDVSLESRPTENGTITEHNTGAPPTIQGPFGIHINPQKHYPSVIFHGENSQTLFGDINDGGAEIQLNTFNGNIYIRRGN